MKTKLENYKTYLINLKKSLVYYQYLKVFFQYLELNQLDFYSITKDQIAEYFAFKKYKPNAINNVIKSIRNFCKYLDLKEHSILNIALLEIEKRLPKYITHEELLKAIKYYSTYSNRGMTSTKCNALLKFLFFTGLRKSELLALKREDIDLTNCAIRIFGLKDKEERMVYFPDSIIKSLVDYFNEEKENTNAFNITPTELWYLTKKISKYLNKNISPHTLRHSSAKYLVEKNVSPVIIQKILGHNSLQTTMIYTDVDEKIVQSVYKKQIG